jgi:antitoxin VapB
MKEVSVYKPHAQQLRCLQNSHGRIQEERRKMPTLNIKDPAIHDMARQLALRTGQSLTEAVRTSLRQSLTRSRSPEDDAKRVVERVMKIGRRIAARPVRDSRTPEEILGYNEIGVPE